MSANAKAKAMPGRLRFALAGLIVAAAMLIPVAPASATLGITNFDGGAFDGASFLENSEAVTQAGSHPNTVSTAFSITTTITPAEQELPTEFIKDAIAELPPGLIGNPQAVPRCPIADLREVAEGHILCPPESQVGVVIIQEANFEVSHPDEHIGYVYKLYNLLPPPGIPALLGFEVFNVPTYIAAKLRSDGDYGVTASSIDTNQTLSVKGATVEVWGVPADPSHDLFRGDCIINGRSFEVSGKKLWNVTGNECPSPEADDPRAFFTLPTSCLGPQPTNLTLRGWEGGEDSASFLSHDSSEPPQPIGNTGCAALDFSPTLEARPTTNVADSPSGLNVDVHLPQASDECEPGTPASCPPATAQLRDATVALPPGMAVNPSSANGLGACSSAQAGLLTPIGSTPIHLSAAGAHCPDDAKLGDVEVDTPLLDHPVKGSVYLAAPHDNPFGSLLAIYIALDDPVSGTHATLAGEVQADPATGQLSTTVSQNPQLPVEDVKIHLFKGATAPLRTPVACGTYTTTSALTPWTAPEGETERPSDSWTIARGPHGGCDLPNAPALDAGSVEPIAAHYSPLAINLRREDGTQQFKAITLQPPAGLLAKLAGTESCPDAALAAAAGKSGRDEQADPSCPAGSRLGSVWAAAGAGPAPYWAPGTAYLSGPYKGAPLSMAIVTPAVAGPFDLGTIVVRVALHLDPATAQITAVSDPLPEIIEGIPLDIRAAKVLLDRPEFTRNGTSCNPLAFTGSLLSTLGQSAPLSERFQLAECSRLAFKPKLALRLKGATRRSGNPKLIATLRAAEGEAGIASAAVRLAHSSFLAQSHIRTICTRVQWAADACPAGSVYGRAWAKSPLLGYTLTGNVYLRSSDNPLPDLVADLRGPASQPIRIELDGRTDAVKGALRNSFEAVPDAPVSMFRLMLFGGKRGLVENSTNLCAHVFRASARFVAQNGAVAHLRPRLRADCKRKHRKHKRRHHRGGGRGGGPTH